jgi:hypothetical protein
MEKGITRKNKPEGLTKEEIEDTLKVAIDLLAIYTSRPVSKEPYNAMVAVNLLTELRKKNLNLN